MFFGDNDIDDTRPGFTRRAMLLGGLQLIGFGTLGARLYQLQVMDGRLYAPLADDNRITVQGLAPIRGRIFDRTGRLIVDNVETFQLQLIPSLTGLSGSGRIKATRVAEVLEALAGLIPLTAQRRQELVTRAKQQPASHPIIVAEEITWDQTVKINFHAPSLPGVQTLMSGRRQYHGAKTLGHVVGYVGPVSRFALDDPPGLRLPGTRIGKAGIERGAEDVLRGVAGAVQREVDARGRAVRELGRQEPQSGRDIALTIDQDVQEAVRQRLLPFRRAAAVVLDAQTGDVAAMVSVPGYDPSPLFGTMSPSTWRKLRADRDYPLVDRTLHGQYPPGSTFKMVTALAALEKGAIAPGDVITCRGSVEIAGQAFRCWNRSGHGNCNLHRALVESCDCYFYEIALRTGATRIGQMGRLLGLGQTFGSLGIGQKMGLLPDPDWKRGAKGVSWYDGETLLTGIGQGYVLATPLQLAVMTARLASGRAISPRLTHDGHNTSSDGGPLKIGSHHLAAIRSALRGVVGEPRGTGKAAGLDVSRDAAPGLEVAGKTGTSQVARISSVRSREALEWRHRDHALFVGYISDSRPRYAAAAIIEHGGSGGKTAAPLVREILLDVMKSDPASRSVFRPPRLPA